MTSKVYTNISHESGVRVWAITFPLPAKVLTNSLYRDTFSIRKFSASRQICIYLRCTSDYLFFPGDYTAPAAEIVGAYYFADRRRRRIVTYSVSHVSCTELQVGTVSRKNIRWTLIITRNFSRIDLTFNFEGLNIGVSRRIRLFRTCFRNNLFFSNKNQINI